MRKKKTTTNGNRTMSKIAATKKSSSGKQSHRSTKAAKNRQSKEKNLSKMFPTRTQKGPRIDGQGLEPSRARESAASDRQSGDLEGLSRVEQADSESVDELIEEGNIREAGAVAGVEAADDEDTKEVHSHQFPEDDVPDEYLKRD